MYLDVGGIQVKILAQTPQLELFDLTIDKEGLGPGLHFHRKMTEMFYLISGEVDFTIGGKAFTATPLEFYTATPNTVHQWKSRGPARMLLQFSPSQNQAKYFAALAEFYQKKIPWGEAIAELSKKYDNNPASP
jgi:quercetin dioxygenase-like cupin family protein